MLNNQKDTTSVAVARGKAALERYERSKASGSPSQIEAARAEMEIFRRELQLVKAESQVFDTIKSAMKKATASPNLSKRAQEVRRKGPVPFRGR